MRPEKEGGCRIKSGMTGEKKGADLSIRAPQKLWLKQAQPCISSSSLPFVSWMNFCTRKKLITAETA